MDITREFNEPFSEQTSSIPSSFSASVVGLAGRPYLLDTESGRYTRQGVDVVQQRNTSDNRDLLLLPQDIWRQMQQSWHMGAGQSNLDRDNALPYRYNDSFGIDPWTQWKTSLLPRCQRLLPLSNANKCFVVNSSSYFVVVNSTGSTNTTLYWYLNTSTPIAAQAGYANTCIDVTSDGQRVFTLHDDGKVYVQPTEVSSTIFINTLTANASAIGWVKDHLIAGDGHDLHDITNGSKSNIGSSYPNTAFRWIDFCDGPQFIYALGGVGDKWVIHKIGIDPATSNLLPYITAATLPDGEIGYSIGSYLGYIFIGTNKGVRMAQPDTTGDLTLGPIIPTSSPVNCFEGQDRFVWFGKSSIDGSYKNGSGIGESNFPASPVSGLGRMDLSVFTTTALTPAYANDLIAASSDTYATAGTVQSVITFDGKRIFAVNGVGVYYETNYLMKAGWLSQGTISFSVEDIKTALYTQAKWLPLNGSVGIDISYDSSDYKRVVTIPTAESIRTTNIYLDGKQFSRVQPRYYLQRSDANASKGPDFTRWEIRAFPVRGQAFRWTLPIMNYEQVDIDGVTYNRNVLDELGTLVQFVQSGTVFSLQESGQSYLVYGKDFAWQPEKLSSDGSGWQGVFTLIVEEIK